MPYYKKEVFESLRKQVQENHVKNNKRWKENGITDNRKEYYEKISK